MIFFLLSIEKKRKKRKELALNRAIGHHIVLFQCINDDVRK